MFDSRVIVRVFNSVALCASDFFFGFTDTLPLCRECIPHRKSYKLTDMAKDISSRNYDAHDTLCDAQTLQELTYGTCMCKSILRYDAQTVFQPSLLCKKKKPQQLFCRLDKQKFMFFTTSCR